MASNHLNAGAASFTPGGPPAAATGMIPDDSFSAYMDFVDDIHDAMDDDAIDDDASNEGFTEPPPLPISESVSGLPPHLAKHASEFWFPESRDCPTCQGFKYGCRASNDGICPTCCPGGVVGGPPSSLKPQGPSNQSRVPRVAACKVVAVTVEIEMELIKRYANSFVRRTDVGLGMAAGSSMSASQMFRKYHDSGEVFDLWILIILIFMTKGSRSPGVYVLHQSHAPYGRA